MDQIMGNLHATLINPCGPFSRTSLDYAGSFFLKAARDRRDITSNGYLALFFCFATKAVHLEAVRDLRTATFFAALTGQTLNYGWHSGRRIWVGHASVER